MLNRIYNQYQKYGFQRAIKNFIYHLQTREKKRSFGLLNPDKTFYVIRSIDDKNRFYIGPRNNLLANYFYVLSHLHYAISNGWIPIVDQLNYPVYNSVSFPINGSKNAWEYYWQQPCSYTLNEIYNSKNVILSKQNWFSEFDMGYEVSNYYSKKLISFYNYLMQQIPFNDETNKLIKQKMNGVLPIDKKVLGVNYRFGGHSLKHFAVAEGHPIQPEIDSLVKIVAEKMSDWNIEHVFLASDTEEAIKAFSKNFQDKFYFYKRIRDKESLKQGEYNALFDADRINTTSIDYLTEMCLLSKCDSLIGSINSGLRYAMIKNNNMYSHVEVLNCGLVGKD